MWRLASLILRNQHTPTFSQNTKPGHLVPLSTATETVTEHVAGFFCITTLYCSGPFPSGDSVVLQAGYSSLTITVSDMKKVKSWVKKHNKGSFKETGGGNDRQTKAPRCKHESLEGKDKECKLARQSQ